LETFFVTDTLLWTGIKSWTINSPEKWKKIQIKEQKKQAQMDSSLTFIKHNLMVETKRITRQEYNTFLTSFEIVFGHDSTLHYYVKDEQSELPEYIDNLSLKQAQAFCDWKTQKRNYETLIKEGILTFNNDCIVGCDNWSFKDTTLELWIKSQSEARKKFDPNPNSYFRKVRIEDSILQWGFSLVDSSSKSEIDSLKLKIEPCELINHDSLVTENCGFRLLYKPVHNSVIWD